VNLLGYMNILHPGFRTSSRSKDFVNISHNYTCDAKNTLQLAFYDHVVKPT
jgi:hypothetical protein